jgi:WD40 repeat protein
VTFGLDGNALAAADGNGRAYRWDMITGELARTFFPRHSGGLNGVAFGLGDDLLAAAGGSGQVYLWDVVNGQIAGTYSIPGRTTVYAVTSPRAAASWRPPAATGVSTCGDGRPRPGRRVRWPG